VVGRVHCSSINSIVYIVVEKGLEDSGGIHSVNSVNGDKWMKRP
jgi:hypothetical protein